MGKCVIFPIINQGQGIRVLGCRVLQMLCE